jgi:flagellar basal-body rod protein FlgF
MDDALHYLSVNRQRGLRAELAAIANNVANIDTAGFRREGTLFAEYVHAVPGGESLSMADMNARYDSREPGTLSLTGGELDLAIRGEGFFSVADGEGVMLTRAGSFQRSADGLLVTPEGRQVLDDGGAPIFLPPDAGRIEIGADGTVSADGQLQARIGVLDAPPQALRRIGNTAFRADPGATEPVAEPQISQGAIEGSNVDAVSEIARMIAVSRAYAQVQGLIRDEDDRVRETIRTLGEPA